MERPLNRRLPIGVQTLFSDLEQRARDADFTETFDRGGRFLKRLKQKRYYWYFQRRDGAKVVEKYVGPFTNPEITKRVAEFTALKNDFKERRSMLRALVAGGLPVSEPMSGSVIDAMCRAGFFRLRGVLVGSTAFQCYSGVLGVRLADATLRTADADFAQFYAIAQQIDDKMPPMIDVLRGVDTTFREIPHLSDSRASTKFINDAAFKVEFLTPNRGSDDYQGKASPMPTLGGASADPLRYLDFLIHHPINSLVLHEAGVPVTIPAPERFAVHKLLFSHNRADRSKSNKDIAQVSAIIHAMADLRSVDLSEAWQVAWQRGPAWSANLTKGLSMLDDATRDALASAVVKGAGRRQITVKTIWPQNL